MIEEAKKEYGDDIRPSKFSVTWEKAFTEEKNQIFLWFTTPKDKSTQMIIRDKITGKYID